MSLTQRTTNLKCVSIKKLARCLLASANASLGVKTRCISYLYLFGKDEGGVEGKGALLKKGGRS